MSARQALQARGELQGSSREPRVLVDCSWQQRRTQLSAFWGSRHTRCARLDSLRIEEELELLFETLFRALSAYRWIYVHAGRELWRHAGCVSGSVAAASTGASLHIGTVAPTSRTLKRSAVPASRVWMSRPNLILTPPALHASSQPVRFAGTVGCEYGRLPVGAQASGSISSGFAKREAG